MASDSHDRLVAGAGFSQLRKGCVASRALLFLGCEDPPHVLMFGQLQLLGPLQL